MCFPVSRGKEMKKQQHKDTAMVVVDDVCESEGVCEVMYDVLSDQPELGEVMEMHVSEEEVAHKSSLSGENTDLSAAACDSEHMRTESQTTRYSYRLVFTFK